MRIGLCLCFLMMISDAQAKRIDAAVSHTLFYLQEKGNMKAYVETYWEINPKSIYFVKTDTNISARIKTSIIFSNDSGVVNEDHFILQTRPVTSIAASLAQSIIESHRYMMPYGKIKMQVLLTDMADTFNHYNYTDSFTIARHDASTFYSGIELLDTAFSSQIPGAFQKNNMQQIPLSSNFLDENRNRLYYYFELYHTDLLSPEDYPLLQELYIARKTEDPPFPAFLKRDTITSKEAKDISPMLGSLDISTLTSGNYFINVALVGTHKNKIAGASLFFQRLNTKPIAVDSAASASIDSAIEQVKVLDLRKTFIAKYNLGQVRSILRMLLPVSDAIEVQTINGFLKNPEELYMRYFIYNFFSNINRKDPEKAWNEFTDKVREVNKLFGSSSTPGYETERGGIYLKYDKPDERVIVENESNTYPYEVWQYNTLRTANKKVSNAVFLFYKPNGLISGYTLLHSTVPGEVRNPNWRNYLYLNGKGSGDNNARAEQYIGTR